MYEPKIFRGQFSQKFKKSLKIYLFLHLLARNLKLSKKNSFYSLKYFEYCDFENIKN